MIEFIRRHINFWRLGRELSERDGFVLITTSSGPAAGIRVWRVSSARREWMPAEDLFTGAEHALRRHAAEHDVVMVPCALIAEGAPGVYH